MNLIEIFAVATGLIAVFLATRQNVWNWPIGLVNVALYAVVFWQSRLYADMGLQVVYFALSIYGWYEWLYGGSNKTELPVTRSSPRLLLELAAIAIAFAVILGTVLHRYTDAALPYMDSSLSSASLAAQYLLTRKKLENWIVWLVADFCYVGMFIFKSLYLTAGLYALFVALAVMGYVQWKRTLVT
ncbi:MAG: nicotinamide riboside transporter PnuC [Gemmatimonadota bacterium]|nr:nicotinamide riboside transporter PnuC [Gemmatimonadota bacterium]